MSNNSKIKSLVKSLPQILQYGSRAIMLQSSVRPQIKSSTYSAIKILKDVAYENGVVSLSANQIGLEERVFVALRPQVMVAGKWTNYLQQFVRCGIKNGDDGYEGIISPLQITSSFEQYYGWQECPSFPGLQFKIKIPININIQYLSEKILKNWMNEDKSHQVKSSHRVVLQIPKQLYIEQKLVGFKGRVWDHQIRHLQGLLPIEENISGGKFYLLDEYRSEIENIQQYQLLQEKYKLLQEKNLEKMAQEQEEKVKAREKGVKNGNMNNDKLDSIEQIGENIDEHRMEQWTKNRQQIKLNKTVSKKYEVTKNQSVIINRAKNK